MKRKKNKKNIIKFFNMKNRFLNELIYINIF